MKTQTYKLMCVCVVSLMTACTEDFIHTVYDGNSETDLTRSNQKEGEVFYYYGFENKKIFLNQVRDKVMVKFATNTTKDQFRSVVNAHTSTKSTISDLEEYFVEGGTSNTVVLESAKMTSEALNSLKGKAEIVSATYILETGGSQSAYTDEFVVKLKKETSYAQLQELAAKNHCIVGDENEFVKNQFMLYVSKDSELDAMQTANLFYETGLFEFAEPNYTYFDISNHGVLYTTRGSILTMVTVIAIFECNSCAT